MSMFKPETSSLPIYFKDKGVFKNAPVANGKIDPKAHNMIRDFLLDRTHELEEFGPKRLDEEHQSKINEIINFMTGKSSSSMSKPQQPSSNDFDFEETETTNSGGSSSEDDDFFSDL
jgi:hypothetical protein